MPQSVRSLLVRVVANSVSDSDEIDRPGSPQADALEWIVSSDPAYLCPEDPALIPRYTMAVFYYSTLGDRWTQCSAPTDFASPEAIAAANANCNIEPLAGSGSDAWLTPSSVCAWGGVVCDPGGDGDVIILDMGTLTKHDESFGLAVSKHFTPILTSLFFAVVSIPFYDATEANGLAGTIASELRELADLRELSLETGVISGVIPTAITELSDLEIIDLNFNLIGGPIPEGIYSLPNLQQLDLNDNALTGTISSSIGELTGLTFFQVQNNQLRGEIPSSMGDLFNLGKLLCFNTEI